MIVMALCGAVCGIDSWTDVEEFANVIIDWFRKYLPLGHGVPSLDTFGRVFALLDTDEFYECLRQWSEALAASLHDQHTHILNSEEGGLTRRS